MTHTQAGYPFLGKLPCGEEFERAAYPVSMGTHHGMALVWHGSFKERSGAEDTALHVHAPGKCSVKEGQFLVNDSVQTCMLCYITFGY